MSEAEDILANAGGIEDGGAGRARARDPRRLWGALENAPRVDLFGEDRVTAVAEIRILPGGAGGILRDADESYWLLSPEDLEEIARTTPLQLR